MDRQRSVLLVGGGGHCASVLDSVLALGEYERIGIIDKDVTVSMEGIPVVGKDEDLPGLRQAGWNEAFVCVGSVGSPVLRQKLFGLIRDAGYQIPDIIDPTAVIAGNVIFGAGVFVGKKAVINAGCRIGDGAIINTGAIIEHECRIGSFAHVSPGAVLCGQVQVGDRSHVGAASAVRQTIRIGEDVMVGMGSVVTQEIPDRTEAYGNPCRVVGAWACM